MLDKKDDTLEVVKGEVTSSKNERTKFTPDPNKIYGSTLGMNLVQLQNLPAKNPIAFEVSRAIKKFEEANTKFEEAKSDLMTDYLLVDETGGWVLDEKTKKALEAAKEQKLNIAPTVFAYIVDGDGTKELEYRNAMDGLLNEEQTFTLKSVNAKSKLIKVNEAKIPLIDLLSDHFESGQINFLEKIGILTGLDD